MSRLDDSLRETAFLVVGEELSHAEAAEILGISVKTLYNRLEAYAASDATAREMLGSEGLQQEAQ